VIFKFEFELVGNRNFPYLQNFCKKIKITKIIPLKSVLNVFKKIRFELDFNWIFKYKCGMYCPNTGSNGIHKKSHFAEKGKFWSLNLWTLRTWHIFTLWEMFRSQSDKRNLILRKCQWILNYLMVHYLNLDHNIAAV